MPEGNNGNKQPKFDFIIDDNIAQGIYSNVILMNHTETEVLFDFIFMQPTIDKKSNSSKGKVIARVILNPINAKKLLNSLSTNLAMYESKFGIINIGKVPPATKNINN